MQEKDRSKERAEGYTEERKASDERPLPEMWHQSFSHREGLVIVLKHPGKLLSRQIFLQKGLYKGLSVRNHNFLALSFSEASAHDYPPSER